MYYGVLLYIFLCETVAFSQKKMIIQQFEKCHLKKEKKKSLTLKMAKTIFFFNKQSFFHLLDMQDIWE